MSKDRFRILTQLLHLLHLLLYRVHSWVLGHRRGFCLTLLLLGVGCFYLSLKTPIAVRTEDFGNKNLTSYKDLEQLKQEYAFEDKLTLIINKGSSFTPGDFCKIHNWLTREVETNPAITNSASLFDLRAPTYKDERLFYPRLLSDPCDNKTDLEGLRKHPLLTLFSNREVSDFVVHFEIARAKKEFRHGVYDYEVIKQIISRAEKELPFEVLPGGTLYFQSSVLDGINFSHVVNIIASLLLFGLYYLFYRSLIASFALIILILITVTVLKAGMTLAGHYIDPLSSCLFLMLTVAILEDFILLSYVLFKKKLSFRLSIKRLLLPSFLTSLTTAIGFGSLSLSDNPSIVHFSIWCALGAMLEWVLIFLVVPCLLEFYPKLRHRLEAHPLPVRILPKLLERFTPSKLLTLVFTLIPFSLFFIHQEANINYSPYDMFTSSHPVTKFREHILKTRNSEGEISVLFMNPETKVEPFVKKFRQDPQVSDTFSEVEVSRQLALLPENLHSLIMSDFKLTPLGSLFQSRESRRVIVSIKSYESKEIPALMQRLEKVCGNECVLRSEIITSNDYVVGVLNTLYDSFASGFTSILLLITFLVLALSPRYLVPVLISTVWASMALLLFVVVFQFRINIVTCVALSVLIGAAGDNAIQFLLFSKGSLRNSVKDLGQASTENFVLMTAISSTLLLSYFQTPRILSVLMITGVCFMLIGDLWVLNGLNRLLVKEEEDQS